jgi:hypothetical protein
MILMAVKKQASFLDLVPSQFHEVLTELGLVTVTGDPNISFPTPLKNPATQDVSQHGAYLGMVTVFCGPLNGTAKLFAKKNSREVWLKDWRELDYVNAKTGKPATMNMFNFSNDQHRAAWKAMRTALASWVELQAKGV